MRVCRYSGFCPPEDETIQIHRRFVWAGDVCTMHYVGTLVDGTQFDSSRDNGKAFSFPLGEGKVIKVRPHPPAAGVVCARGNRPRQGLPGAHAQSQA